MAFSSKKRRSSGLGLAVGAALALAGPALGFAQPNLAGAPTPTRPDRLQNLPRKGLSDRIAVTIYQFRSGVAAVNNSAATDMFTTALIRSGQFRVVERAQFNP